MGIVFKQTFQYIDEGETSSSDFVTSVTQKVILLLTYVIVCNMFYILYTQMKFVLLFSYTLHIILNNFNNILVIVKFQGDIFT